MLNTFTAIMRHFREHRSLAAAAFDHKHLLFANREGCTVMYDGCYLNGVLISPHTLLLLSAVISPLLMAWLISFLWQLHGLECHWHCSRQGNVFGTIRKWMVFISGIHAFTSHLFSVWHGLTLEARLVFNFWIKVKVRRVFAVNFLACLP